MGPLLARAIVLAAILVGAGAAPAAAATFTVNSPNDAADVEPDGTCDVDPDAPVVCTLREAVREANASAGADTVVLPADQYNLTLRGSDEDVGASGDLDVTGPLTISGAGARTTIIDQTQVDRVFHILGTAGNVTFAGVTISGGMDPLRDSGAGIRSLAQMSLIDAAVRDNEITGTQPGAGISTDEPVTITRSLLTGNETAAAGGAIHSNDAPVTIDNSTVSGNTAASGAAFNGVGTDASLSVSYSTITANTSTSAGGAAIVSPQPLAFGPRASIVAGNDATDCGGPANSLGHNIESGTSCGFDNVGDRQNVADPRIGPLADNGGSTDTHALLSGSPAFDAAPAASCPASDQRGFPRPGFATCDIGAFEVQGSPPPPPAQPAFVTLDPAAARRRPGADNVVTATVRNGDGTPSAGRIVRYSIAGPNRGAGTATTDGAGVARIAWEGVREGTDTLTAFVDTNANGTRDGGIEPVAQARVVWALPAPRQGLTVNLEPVSGVVRIRVPRRRSSARVGPAGLSPRTQRLTEARQVPLRAVVDTRRGRVRMTSVSGPSRNLQRGEFYGGVFTTRQPSRGRSFTELRMTERLRCVRRGGLLQPARARSRRLWGRVRRRARFRTRGRYSSAAVRGTVWLQKDTCNSTTTVVREGVVAVRDFGKRRTVRVKAGRRYVARATRRR